MWTWPWCMLTGTHALSIVHRHDYGIFNEPHVRLSLVNYKLKTIEKEKRHHKLVNIFKFHGNHFLCEDQKINRKSKSTNIYYIDKRQRQGVCGSLEQWLWAYGQVHGSLRIFVSGQCNKAQSWLEVSIEIGTLKRHKLLQRLKCSLMNLSAYNGYLCRMYARRHFW